MFHDRTIPSIATSTHIHMHVHPSTEFFDASSMQLLHFCQNWQHGVFHQRKLATERDKELSFNQNWLSAAVHAKFTDYWSPRADEKPGDCPPKVHARAVSGHIQEWKTPKEDFVQIMYTGISAIMATAVYIHENQLLFICNQHHAVWSASTWSLPVSVPIEPTVDLPNQICKSILQGIS